MAVTRNKNKDKAVTCLGNYKEMQYSSHSGWMYGQDTYISADKSKRGCKNVLGVVMDVTDDDYYKIRTKEWDNKQISCTSEIKLVLAMNILRLWII